MSSTKQKRPTKNSKIYPPILKIQTTSNPPKFKSPKNSHLDGLGLDSVAQKKTNNGSGRVINPPQ
jgi:hypothetical protein